MIVPECITQDSPDYISESGRIYYFNDMMMAYKGKAYPLRWDKEGLLIDFFDWDGDQYWIDCGEEVKRQYLNWLGMKLQTSIDLDSMSSNEIKDRIRNGLIDAQDVVDYYGNEWWDEQP